MTVVRGPKRPKTAHEKLKALETIEAIRTGKIDVPLRCGWCRSSSLLPSQDLFEPDVFECLQCSRRTTRAVAHRLRQQELRALIASGR